MTAFTHNTQQQWQRDAIMAAGHMTSGYMIERFVGVERVWWQNPLNQFSLRLTHTGYKWLQKNSKWKFHEIELVEKIMPRQMLQLERLLTSPYFIRKLDLLYVHSEQDAVMLQLHGGDLNTYLDNLQQNQ